MAGFEPVSITKGFLVDTVTQERLIFQYNPSELKLQRTPKWADVTVPGMSHPKLQWINGGERKFTFKLEFFYNEEGREAIRNKVNWLESLTYPDFGDDYLMAKGAHPVLFNFGDLYKNVRCAVTGFDARFFDMFDPETLLPLISEVNLELSELIFDTAMGVFRSKSSSEIRG